MLKEKWNTRITLKNDGKCAALAEKKLGNLKDYNDCVFINIGTGIGGAVFLSGEMLTPTKFPGFEIGHMVILKDGIQCNCGNRGCFEKYASMKALKDSIRKAYNLDSNTHSRELMEILSNNSEMSNAILNEYLGYLKVGLTNLINLFEPEAICFGGSFAYYENIFLDAVKEKINEQNSTFNERHDINIHVAKMQNDAGILGAIL